MTIIGGGFVAAEFAHVFSALGTEVTHRPPRPTAAAAARTRRSPQPSPGLRPAAVGGAAVDDGRRRWPPAAGRPGRSRSPTAATLETDVLLIATGRVPNADRLGPGAHRRRGARTASSWSTSTSAPRSTAVWALGDVANTWHLKHVANAEARVVRHNLLFPDELVAGRPPVRAERGVHLPPGGQRRADRAGGRGTQGIEHRSVTHDYADVAYGWAMESTPGDSFVKLLGTPDGQHLLGAHVIGPQASNLIQPLIQAMSLGTTVRRDGARPVLDPSRDGRSRRERTVENDPLIAAGRLFLP